ncbi:MAG: restriction endonuclease subunit S [Salinisphaera sp.]|jgi:type I restriction enzyme S subunit|nr:restriction endonuclease subunit S [Salinisphaera sp.]
MKTVALPKHNSFEPSGFDWVGDVPSHWSVEKLGSILKPISKKNRPDLPLLSITREQGVIERDVEDQDSNHNFIPDDLSGYKVLRKGQFGMNKMKAWQGSYGVSPYTGIVSPAYFIFDFVRGVDPNFFNAAIRSRLYISYFGSASDGVRIGQWDLNQSRMRQIPVLLPPLPEQRAIAAFLDKKCAKIDEAVRIKEEQITLLRERRQILIQQAVTRGLNPDAPMKDSGIDWIGEIPAHWEAVPLKRLFRERNRRTRTGEETLFSLRMVEGLVPHDDVSEKLITDADLVDYKKVYAGQLVMNRMRASIGLFGIVDHPGLVSPDYATFDVRDNLFGPFYLNLFKTALMGNRFRLSSRGLGTGSSGFMRLYTENFGSISVPVPTYGEQQEIVKYIYGVTEKIDGAIRLKKSQINTLKEYKASLINEAVTGKIKVT